MSDYQEAYILKTLDYQEHSKLVYLYSPQGKFSALARGVKKINSPLSHLVQPGALAMFSFSKGKLPTLKEAENLVYFKAIKSDLIKSSIVGVINDIIYYNITDHENHEKLFTFLKKFLKMLNLNAHPLELLMVFEMKLLAFLGYFINFNHCHACSDKDPLTMAVGTGIIACSKHQTSRYETFDETIYGPLKYYLHCDILDFQSQNLTVDEIKQLYKIIDELYETQLSFSSKAKKIVTTLL